MIVRSIANACLPDMCGASDTRVVGVVGASATPVVGYINTRVVGGKLTAIAISAAQHR